MAWLRKPRALRPGATLGVAAPGGPVEPQVVEAGAALFEKAGFRTFWREDLFERRGYLAGDDERRIDELLQLWADPAIDAIVCARGGYGCDRILHRLDPGAASEAAKPLVGYSDITALLLWQQRCAGLAGFHGPMLERGADLASDALDLLVEQLTGDVRLPLVLPGEVVVPGVADGPLVGGSLTLAAASLGTIWEIDTDGAILLLEEVNERPYRIDRMLQQLRGAGKLAGIVGLGFGDLSSCADDRYGSTAAAVVAELAESLGVPCLSDLPFGHVPSNLAWPVGGRATLDAENGELRILERGVEVSS